MSNGCSLLGSCHFQSKYKDNTLPSIQTNYLKQASEDFGWNPTEGLVLIHIHWMSLVGVLLMAQIKMWTFLDNTTGVSEHQSWTKNLEQCKQIKQNWTKA